MQKELGRIWALCFRSGLEITADEILGVSLEVRGKGIIHTSPEKINYQLSIYQEMRLQLLILVRDETEIR